MAGTDDHRIAACAAALRVAETTGQTIAPLTEGDADLTIALAYQIQETRRALDPAPVIGYKLGYTSAAMRAQMNIDEPNYGVLTPAHAVSDRLNRVKAADLIHPLAEPEIALRLGRAIMGPNVTREQLAEAIDAVFPAIEIVDSRIADWKITFADTVADNPGLWLFHCHVAEHMANGMFARVTVHPAAGPGVSRDPGGAFFGLPAAWQTLKITNAEFADGNKGEDAAIYLDGEVTVADPLPVAHTVFTVSIGAKTIELKPDASGIASAPEGLLLVKNISPYGNGNVTGGRLTFELTLKGAGWVDTHGKDAAPITIGLKVGEAVHTAACILKAAAP